MKSTIFLIFILVALISCKQSEHVEDTSKQEEIDWYLKDLEQDSLPGISLERAYKELIDEDKGDKIIVAVIDYQIDVTHEDLVSQIYSNPKEIPDNNIDDDKNGYVDDIHGWNFIGLANNNESLKHGLDENTRIVKRLQIKYQNKEKEAIAPKDTIEYLKYKRAVERRNSNIDKAEYLLEYTRKVKEEYMTFKEYFFEIYPHYDNYELADLDSVETDNDDEAEILSTIKRNLEYGVDLKTVFEEEKRFIIQKYTSNNLSYNDRELIGDDPYNYDDTSHGNNYVQASPDIVHGTLVAGAFAATRNNGKGTRGISNNIKIMVLPILTETGTENDKDFYNAIRYAVDNGTKVINFSSGKLVSDNGQVLFDALKYAEKNNVLVVTSGGNNSVDIGQIEHEVYPMDQNDSLNIVNNLIKVGASTPYIDGRLMATFSNYSKENIDLFAPGDEIRTPTAALKKYEDNVMGTSISSALTSGVAALLLSYYPDLSAIQVKNILMESGSEYDVLIEIAENDSVPFKDLSKSGKILNAFNALKMAKEISKKKK